jgi:5-(carboxyamino)imidazole ribonucleotide mutase
MSETKPVVGIIMGSNSDWPTMKAAAKMLEDSACPSRRRSSPPTAPPT